MFTYREKDRGKVNSLSRFELKSLISKRFRQCQSRQGINFQAWRVT